MSYLLVLVDFWVQKFQLQFSYGMILNIVLTRYEMHALAERKGSHERMVLIACKYPKHELLGSLL